MGLAGLILLGGIGSFGASFALQEQTQGQESFYNKILSIEQNISEILDEEDKLRTQLFLEP